MCRDPDQRDFARNLRSQPTEAEKSLRWFLRAEQLGCKFRRQAAIGPYIVDFICFSHQLIVELDGPQHAESSAKEYDARRTAWLAARGFRVLRFRNHELDENIHGVVEAIRRALGEVKSAHEHRPSPALPVEGREPDKG
jgi:very-short-patch-repair endonuclease